MARTDAFGPVFVSVAASAGTGANDRLCPLNAYREAYLTSAYCVLPVSQGPIFGYCVLKTAGVPCVLAPAAWISSDANFGAVDSWLFLGQQPISPQGGNELIPLLRNDTSAAVTAQVGGTLRVERD